MNFDKILGLNVSIIPYCFSFSGQEAADSKNLAATVPEQQGTNTNQDTKDESDESKSNNQLSSSLSNSSITEDKEIPSKRDELSDGNNQKQPAKLNELLSKAAPTETNATDRVDANEGKEDDIYDYKSTEDDFDDGPEDFDDDFDSTTETQRFNKHHDTNIATSIDQTSSASESGINDFDK